MGVAKRQEIGSITQPILTSGLVSQVNPTGRVITDALGSGGVSGGAVLNRHGQVVGIASDSVYGRTIFERVVHLQTLVSIILNRQMVFC
jgi:S1-C subfamily serine protease